MIFVISDVIEERFLGYINVTGDTTGDHLASCIKAQIKDVGLDIEKLRGHCYDGAGRYYVHTHMAQCLCGIM